MMALILLYVYICFTLLLIPVVLVRHYEPAATVAWILSIVFLPIVGALFFIFFGIRFAGRGTRVVRESNEQIHHLAREYQNAYMQPFFESLDDGYNDNPMTNLCRKLGTFEPSGGNHAIYSVDSHKTYQLMEQVISEAKHHINMEYYIYLPDEVGLRFIDLLMAKAAEGVKVHFLYDSLGSWALHRNRKLRRRMQEAGVNIQPFIITRRLFRPWYLNLRNHRKILVVDGKTGFAGGLNVGSIFLSPAGHEEKWRDAQLMIQGPAVAGLQWIFTEDWHFSTGELLIDENYFPKPEACGDLTMQVLSSGPDEECETAEMILFNAITTSTKQIYLCSPYFVPDSAILFALKSAALRGVDVRLILPKRTDHFSVYLAGRSYYEDLLSCGVKIYEYVSGVMHSKVLIVDEELTIVSSINLDIRSFRFNFEVSAQIWGKTFAGHVLKEFSENLKHSEQIHLESFKERSFFTQMAENGCRLFSPLL